MAKSANTEITHKKRKPPTTWLSFADTDDFSCCYFEAEE